MAYVRLALVLMESNVAEYLVFRISKTNAKTFKNESLKTNLVYLVQ